MSWFFLIQGRSITVSIEDGYAFLDKLNNLDIYKNLQMECNNNGLVLQDNVDSDGNLHQVSLMCGYELYPGRYSYPGNTVVLKPELNIDHKLLDRSMARLIECVSEVTNFPSLEVVITGGLIYSQFD